MSIRPMLRRPTAFLPLVMSMAALALVIGYVTLNGVPPASASHDEGTPARVFQLLLAAQVPIMMVFGITWLPRAPRQALLVLVLQAAAILMALAPVVILEM